MERSELFKTHVSVGDNFAPNIEEVNSLIDYGKNEAIKCIGNLEMYNIYLRRIESGHIVKKTEMIDDQKNDIEEKNNQIKQIESTIEDKREKINELDKIIIPKTNSNIEKKKVVYGDLSNKDPRDTILTDKKYRPWAFYGLLFFIIMLTISLYYFYVNLGYVLFDLPNIMSPELAFSCSPQVLNSLDQLLGNGGCNVSAGFGSLLLPIIFLAIATIIHRKLESAMLSDKKIYGYLFILFFVILVLILDVILAVKFEEKLFSWAGEGGIYGNQFPEGIIEQIKYCIDRPAFILILGLGFMSYVIWSLLIHELSIELERKDPEIIWRRKLKNIEQDINRMEIEVDKFENEKEIKIPNEIRELKKQINNIRQSIKLIKIGGKEELRKGLLEFSIGWSQFINFKYATQELLLKQAELRNALEKFLEASSLGKRGISEELQII